MSLLGEACSPYGKFYGMTCGVEGRGTELFTHNVENLTQRRHIIDIAVVIIKEEHIFVFHTTVVFYSEITI